MFQNYYYFFNQLLFFLGSSLKNHETGSGLRLALLYLWHSLQQDNPLSLLNDISLICLLIRPDLIKVFVQSHVSMPPQAHVVCVSVLCKSLSKIVFAQRSHSLPPIGFPKRKKRPKNWENVAGDAYQQQDQCCDVLSWSNCTASQDRFNIFKIFFTELLVSGKKRIKDICL